MQYIVIPSESKEETTFLMKLLKRMKKEATTLSTEEMEDLAFITALKEAEKSGKGSMAKVKAHLSKVAVMN